MKRRAFLEQTGFGLALAVAVEKKKINGRDYETAVFDIVLEAEK